MSTQRDARRGADTVWIAWLVAGAVIVVLTVNVVRHLAARHHVHTPASDAIFRAGGTPLGPLLSHPALARYQPLHATHAELLRRAGDPAGAARAYERAIALSTNAVERAELERRLQALDAG